jgi:hypothetical protein
MENSEEFKNIKQQLMENVKWVNIQLLQKTD